MPAGYAGGHAKPDNLATIDHRGQMNGRGCFDKPGSFDKAACLTRKRAQGVTPRHCRERGRAIRVRARQIPYSDDGVSDYRCNNAPNVGEIEWTTQAYDQAY